MLITDVITVLTHVDNLNKVMTPFIAGTKDKNIYVVTFSTGRKEAIKAKTKHEVKRICSVSFSRITYGKIVKIDLVK